MAIPILVGLLFGITIYLVQSTYFRRKDRDKYALVRRFERTVERGIERLFPRKQVKL